MPLGAVYAAAFLALIQGVCAVGNVIDCIRNTGGTCRMEECYSWRGPTDCKSGRCFCTQGTCAGADGICTHSPYEKPVNNTQYRLKNARWPKYYIDADFSGSVSVTKRGTDGDDNRFTISVPSFAGGQESLHEPVFLVASVKWPKAVLHVVEEETNNNQNTRQYGTVVKNVDGGWGGLLADPSVIQLGIVLTVAPDQAVGEDPPLMLSSYMYRDYYFVVSSLGWDVQTYRNDPGAGGYWYFEPRLPRELRNRLRLYSGPRCSMSCGTIESARYVSSAASSAGVFLAALASLLGAALSAVSV